MGVVCLDIPNLSAINGSLGFEYGSRLLWFTSKTLADLFGAGWLFRTWDAEFVALSPNTDAPGLSEQVRASAQPAHEEVSAGSAHRLYMDNADFTAKDLVNEAREIMQQERGFPILTQDGLMRRSRAFRKWRKRCMAAASSCISSRKSRYAPARFTAPRCLCAVCGRWFPRPAGPVHRTVGADGRHPQPRLFCARPHALLSGPLARRRDGRAARLGESFACHAVQPLGAGLPAGHSQPLSRRAGGMY